MYSVQEHPYKLTHEGLDCQYCGKVCKSRNSLCNHERLCPSNKNRTLPNSGFAKYNQDVKEGRRVPWNKGQTKETNESLRAESIKNSEMIRQGKSIGCFGLKGDDNPAKRPEVRKKLSEKMLKVCSEIPERKRGRGIRGRYKGIWCDSTWELAYVIYAIEHDINFIRNSNRFEYEWEGKTHSYFPDFYLPDSDSYVEIKGYYDARSRAKLEQFPGKIHVFTKDELKQVFDYVHEKYTEPLYLLYDDMQQ